MRVTFQADADFNHRIVLGLRRSEPAIDCLGAHEGGVVGLTDPEVLRIAAVSGRVLYRMTARRWLDTSGAWLRTAAVLD